MRLRIRGPRKDQPAAQDSTASTSESVAETKEAPEESKVGDKKQRQAFGAKGAWTAAAIAIIVSLLSTLTLSTPTKPRGPLASALFGQGETQTVEDSGESISGAVDGTAAAGGTQQGAGKVKAGGKSYDCTKGQNAGATDVGVSDRLINFAATIVTSGVAKDFLYDAQFGIEAIRNKVNRRGGICGRLINVDYKDDGWNQDRGQRTIEGFIGSNKYFGLAVNPSSEGLRGAIDSGLIRNAGFPVIGADGMLVDQYQDPWVWPVATSTSSVMHVMAQNALSRGAKTFGIVWETNYRFGVEGHDAFVGAVKRAGGVVSSDKGVQSDTGSYSNDVNEFLGNCGGVHSLNKCDFIAVLLEPNTASQWVRDGGLGDGTVRPSIGIGGPQPLFLDSFATDCRNYCANMWVWTSFKPPIPPFDTESLVATYKNDLLTYGGNTKADANNPHVQGAYVGMSLLVEALKRMGPAPTRAGMKQILDSITFETGLAPALQFHVGNHFSSVSAQSFQAIVQGNAWQNWRYTQSGFIPDQEVGKDIRSN